uniref:flavocytochrome c n=1 Tax=Ndongobacter massiliensis TaxID=1871025 RepID=UPI000930309D|nr:flavocytochrome c [Ndongobacter massiliensis]
MKKFIQRGLSLLLAMSLLAACSPKGEEAKSDAPQQMESVAEEVSSIKDGTYTGEGQGNNGPIQVNVTFAGGKITQVEVTEHKETEGLSDPALEKIPQEIVDANSVSVDVIAGATMTSNGILEAVKAAIAEAGGKVEDFEKVVEKSEQPKEKVEETHDLVIIGGGGAGLIAAISAREAGVQDIVVLEKMSAVGGNTLISGAEYAAPGNELQKKEGIEDSVDLLYEDVMKGGGNPDLVRYLADHALEGADWLTNDIHVDWEKELMFFGGHSVKRSLIPYGNRGTEIIGKLNKRIEEEKIPVYLNTKATDLETDESGAIKAVRAESPDKEYTIQAKAVILATGGFGNNVDMRVKYNPDIDGSILSTNAKGIDGDGIVMAEKLGADLVGMEHIQLYPVCDPDTGALLYVDDTRLMGSTIMVNKEGKRFVEELDTRYVISMAVKEQTDSVGYELMTKAAAEKAGVLKNHMPEVESLMKRGHLVEGATLQEVADKMGVDAKQLEATVERWNGFVENGKDEDFNKRGELSKIDQGPYWLLRFVPAVHHTMGGVKINTETQVLKADGSVIPGFFAAGEVTGGIHGDNRLGSVAITDITVFGRQAGEQAAAYLKEK